MIPDYLRGPSIIIPEVLGKTSSQVEAGETRGAPSQGLLVPPRGWEGDRVGVSPRASRRSQPCRRLDFSSLSPASRNIRQ